MKEKSLIYPASKSPKRIRAREPKSVCCNAWKDFAWSKVLTKIVRMASVRMIGLQTRVCKSNIGKTNGMREISCSLLLLLLLLLLQFCFAFLKFSTFYHLPLRSTIIAQSSLSRYFVGKTMVFLNGFCYNLQ